MASRALPSDRYHPVCSAPRRRRAPSRRPRWSAEPPITDPLALRELDGGRFRLDRMLSPERSADIPLTNGELFALPSMAPVRQAIDGEFDRYIVRHKASLPNETIGVGDGFDFQLFDRALLYSPETRFVLAGIVNRMDRAYVAADCGEITADLPPDAAEHAGDRRQRFVAAAADDAEPRAEGEGRSRPIARARQSPVPKSPGAGSLPANALPVSNWRNCRRKAARSI